MSDNLDRVTPDVARQREEVAVQRQELGRTIAQLADRVDVTARAREQSARLRARLSSAGPDLILGAVALLSAVASVVAFSSWLRSRRVQEPTD